MMLFSTRKLKRIALYVSDQEVGRIERVFIDTAKWDVRYLLLLKSDLISSKRILITTPSMKNVTFIKNKIHLRSQDQLARATPIEVSIEKSHPEDLVQVKTNLPVLKRQGTYSTLMDAEKLKGYPIRAEDGTRGLLTELAIDLVGWSVRYVIVKKSKWQFWRKTLIPPLWIDSVDTSIGRINVNLPRRAIGKAPELNAVAGITPRLERRVVFHYGSDEFKRQK
jgi:hypothetical protein